jgi:hypothetical protein
MSAKAKLRLLTPNQLDGRTKARRIFDSICAAISADLAPEGDDQLTEIQKHLIVSFAGSALLQQNLIAELLAGKPVNVAEFANNASSMLRGATRLGTERRRKPPLTVDEYLRQSEPTE